MAWTDQQWDTFAGLVTEGWPGQFDDNAADSWRTLLDGTEPATAAEALRRLLLEGHRFRPSVSEVLEAARRDPSKPTFAEAYLLIYGRRGALRARPERRVYRDHKEQRKLEDDAIRERAGQLHPLVATFIDRQGIGRLQQLPVNDPEWGEKHRRDLEKAWDQHAEAMADRDVAQLAAAPGRRHALGKFDPLAALGRGMTSQIEAGDPQ
jgi:hypothetical protein